MNLTSTDRSDPDTATGPRNPLAVWRIATAGGLTAILCFARPTMLALFGVGVVGAGTASGNLA